MTHLSSITTLFELNEIQRTSPGLVINFNTICCSLFFLFFLVIYQKERSQVVAVSHGSYNPGRLLHLSTHCFYSLKKITILLSFLPSNFPLKQILVLCNIILLLDFLHSNSERMQVFFILIRKLMQ